MAKKKKSMSTAFGLSRVDTVGEHGETVAGLWQLVKIEYDLDKGTVGDVSTVPMEDLAYGMERVQVELENELVKKEQENE